MLEKKASLIIYFSKNNQDSEVKEKNRSNTEVVAETIGSLTGGKIIKIEPAIAYSADYDKSIQEAKDRQESHNAPIIDVKIDVKPYEVIYIGAPVYWDLMPEEMVTALKDLDFTGKIIRPFTTHEGSGLGNILKQLKEVCKGAKVLDGLAIRGVSVNNSKFEIEKWVKS